MIHPSTGPSVVSNTGFAPHHLKDVEKQRQVTITREPHKVSEYDRKRFQNPVHFRQGVVRGFVQ